MSPRITGNETRVVDRLQSRLDAYFSCRKTFENVLKEFDQLALQNVEPDQIPAREDRYQILLSEYKKAAGALKDAAKVIEEKTEPAYFDKYFESRRTLWRGRDDHRRVHLDFKNYLKVVREGAQEVLAIDFEGQVTQAQNESQWRKTEAIAVREFSQKESQRRANEEQAALEYSRIDQTFPTCSDTLLKENPEEYLRQATLYQHKLLEKEDGRAVLAFGNEWMKNIPKEATWQQVEDMSWMMLEASKTDKGVALTEYRDAIEQWIKEHPLSENPDSVSSGSSEGRRALVLGLLFYYNPQSTLSPEAFQFYQRCSLLYPDQHGWKIAQAVYHLSHRQWLEAEQALAGLPQDEASVREIQRTLTDSRRERISSAALDLGMIALSRFVPDSYKETRSFDVTQTGLQVVSNEFTRRVWVPFFFKASEPSIPRDWPTRSILTLIADIVDCVFRQSVYCKRHQPVEVLTTSLFRAGNTFYTLVSNPAQRSFPAKMNFVSLLISVKQTSDAYREIRRPAAHNAILSTIQSVASDFTVGVVVLSYSDLFPLVGGNQLQSMAGHLGAQSLTTRVSSAFTQDTEESAKDKWLLGALAIGTLTAYRLYHYPCLWAASVMRDTEFYFSQGKYDDAQRVLAEAENSYFVSSEKPVVRNFARYLNWLKDNPQFLEDPAKSTEFFMHLDLALNTLKRSSYYGVIRNNLLLKKIEITIQLQDTERLSEVVQEGPRDQIVTLGFHFLLSRTFVLVLNDPTAADCLLQKMKPSFPLNFHPIADEYLQLLQTQLTSLQEIVQLNFFTQLKDSSEKIKQWNKALEELQSFFSKHGEKTGVYQDLQYYKLMLAFIQENNTQQTDNFFKESDLELHRRFAHVLVEVTRLSGQRKESQKAIALLKRVAFNSFTENVLMQNYAHFFSSLYSLPLQWDHAFEMKKLERCIAGLDATDVFHLELRLFFSACRVVLSLDAGEQVTAQGHLSQVNTDSGVSDEVAALLFERVYVPMEEDDVSKVLTPLESIVSIGPWTHLELFRSYQLFLASELSEAQIERLTSVITYLTPIKKLSGFAYELRFRKHLLEFKLRLSQENFTAAENLLKSESHREFYDTLRNTLFIFFIERAEQRLKAFPVSNIREDLEYLNNLFAIPDSGMIDSYIDFLVHLGNAKGKRDLTAYEKASQAIELVFEKFDSIHCPIPILLKGKKVEILSQIAILAKKARQWQTALAALEEVQKTDENIEHIDEDIFELKGLVKASK